MYEQVDTLLSNPFVRTLAYYSVAILALVIFLAIFELLTKYNGWAEIKKGNMAAAMAIGGKIFGICNIFRFAIVSETESFYQTFIWASYGYVLLVVAYYIFEFMTPFFNVDREIEKDNRAVGLLSMIISIALSYIIGSSIS